MSASPKPTLTAPFAKIERKGQFDYIPWEECVDRLNVVLGICGWSYTCEVAHLFDKEVVVKGTLTIRGATFEQFAGHTHQTGDWGDTFKSAASKALVKAASLPGVGLYLSLQRSPHGTQFSSEASAQVPSEDSGDGNPTLASPVPAPAAGGEESPGTPAPPPRAPAAKRGSKSTQERRSVPQETSQPDVGNQNDQAEGAGDPQGNGTPSADLSPRVQIQQRLDALSESQRLQLKSLWVEHRLVPFKDAVLEDPYVEKVKALLDSVEAA